MAGPEDLPDELKKAYEQNRADFAELDRQLRSVQEAARLRLVESGHSFDRDAMYCYLCGCPDFIEPEFGPSGECGRDYCHSSIAQHHGGL